MELYLMIELTLHFNDKRRVSTEHTLGTIVLNLCMNLSKKKYQNRKRKDGRVSKKFRNRLKNKASEIESPIVF